MSATITTAPTASPAPAPAPSSPASAPGGSDHTATADERQPPTTALVRMRVLLLLSAFLVVSSTACGIFDRVEIAIVLAPVLPAAGAIVTARRPGAQRLPVAAVLVVATGTIATIASGGGLSDVLDAFTSGFQGLLSTEWPSPDRPDLIGSVSVFLAVAMAASAELATRPRFHLLPLAPLLVAYSCVVALSAPLGVTWTTLVALALSCIVFALFRNEGGLHDRLVLLRGERRLIPLLTIVALITAMLTVPITLASRADPRRTDPAERTAPLLDPIESTLALRDLDPAIPLHLITPRRDEQLPSRWRTAALEDYDGARWTPELTLRPIGGTLGDATGPTVEVDISFLDDDLSLVPLPGPPISVDVPVETDAERTVVRLVDRPEVGDLVGISANRSPSRDAAIGAEVVNRPVPDEAATLSELATALAGDGSPLDQLTQLENTMRNDFVLDNAVAGGGLQQVFIDIFLRDTQRGNLEQFVTGFVLLARSLGVEARVATGFVAGAAGISADGGLALSSSDALVWPEVQLSDGTWLAFDPVPTQEATDIAPPPPEPQNQTPAAPQPPIAPPAEPDTENSPVDEPGTATPDGALSTAIAWALRGGAILGLLLLPFLIAAGCILGIKYRRRRRRTTAPDAVDRIRGSWA
ncbi:MAG: transglutaminaseTgpA domain-containing protein, partial [Ilumatobacteraceae bacterium]